MNPAELFYEYPLSVILNRELSNAAFCLLGVLGATKATAASVNDLSYALSWSRRKTLYKIAELEKLGAIQVSRTPGDVNAYRIMPGWCRPPE